MPTVKKTSTPRKATAKKPASPHKPAVPLPDSMPPHIADQLEGLSNRTTHFGYKTVDVEQKTGMVRAVFDSVAGKYDLMNDLMSAGLHRRWKDEFVRLLDPKPHQRFLDVAGGTGDIALRIHNALASQEASDSFRPITVLDINYAMLAQGRDRAIDENWKADMEWLCGNAERLPLPDRSFDRYTIAFGIRNVTNIPAALVEAYRVLDAGGRFMCLEFSSVENPLLAKAYDAYSFGLIPRIGKLVANDPGSYQYLVESIRKFPNRRDFAAMIEAAGFKNVHAYPLLGGVVCIHSGWKI